MICEAQTHDQNHFVTLTYDPESLPENADLQQADMQNFFKRLRKEIAPHKIRYVYSAEYGDEYSRPHYHAIIYGLTIPDLIQNDSNDRGEPLYGSKFLDRIWAHGQTSTGAVTPQSCGYVAGYMLKDSTGNYDKRTPYICVDPDTGEMTERKRPFARYSNRPGIGKNWLLKYYKSVFVANDDMVRLPDLSIRPTPPYFFDQLQKIDPELYAQVKLKRESSIDDPHNLWNNTPDRKKVRAICRDANLKGSTRGSKTKKQNHVFLNETLS